MLTTVVFSDLTAVGLYSRPRSRLFHTDLLLLYKNSLNINIFKKRNFVSPHDHVI